jgi:hypothetical protein
MRISIRSSVSKGGGIMLGLTGLCWENGLRQKTNEMRQKKPGFIAFLINDVVFTGRLLLEFKVSHR